ncbi:MAG: FtsX-like permease family protein [Nitrospirota bacterium]|nr:FtsX-like permease family protein [Nitrospirota bacterium]
MIPFPLRMAWRETRAAWRHFLYFFACIAVGVAALVGVALFGVNVERAVSKEARALMAGDLEVRVSRQMSQAGEDLLQSLSLRGIETTHVSELVGMASVPHAPLPVVPGMRVVTQVSQIVELKAVGAGYPFYGTLKVEPDRPLQELLHPPAGVCPTVQPIAPPPAPQPAQARKKRLRKKSAEVAAPQPPVPAPCHGMVVQDSLLIRMGLKVGDQLKVGEGTFTITGLVRKEPDRTAGAFSLGPRVFISREGLAATDLIKPGSRVRERYLLRLPASVPAAPLLHELRGRLASESARVIPFQDAQPQLRGFLDQLTRYLGLVGLTALFVGGIGVASTMQAFLREKLQTIAILKTVGAESGTILHTYLTQAFLLSLVGSLAGLAMGVAAQSALPALLSNFLSIDEMAVPAGLSGASVPALVKGLAMGLLTTLLFALWPLLGIRDIRPALIFRRDVTQPVGAPVPGQARRDLLTLWRSAAWRSRLDPLRLAMAAGILLCLAGLSVWQAGNRNVGLLFIGALVAAVCFLRLAAFLLVRSLRSVSRVQSLTLRYAVGNLHRPGNQAAGVMVSIGIGVMVIVTVSLLERALVDQVGEQRPKESPSFFFIDIQPDQRASFLALMQERMPEANVEATPLVRSRLYAVNGQLVETEEAMEQRLPADSEEARREKEKQARKTWYFTREYVLTQGEALPKDNRLIKGTWWQLGERPAKPLVSMEEDAAKHLGVDLGSTVTLDIQGVTVEATVSSIRRVEWGNFSTNFYMILSPGSLDAAPMTYVATIKVPPQEEVPLQQAVVSAFPNVTAINIGDVLDSLARILERLAVAMRAVALFCVLTGGIVMGAALAATRYRRLYESVILKALGATRGLIAQAFALEYVLLGSVAGAIGLLLSIGLSWALLYFIFDLPWHLQPDILLAGFVLTLLLTLAVGFLSTFRLLGQRPLTVLRHE